MLSEGSKSEITECGYFVQFPPFSTEVLHRRSIAFMDRTKGRGRGSLEYEYQRTYKACIPCARRKVKCEAGDDVRCRRCIKKDINCAFTTKKPWSRDEKDSLGTPARENTGRDGSNKCVFRWP